jgi:enoyl-CoA hydratase/carnithine racemase
MAGEILCAIDGAIATVTLRNPGKLNAVDYAMWLRLAEVFAELSADQSLRCVVLRGDGEAFAAGGDLEEFLTLRSTVDQALHYHDEVVAAALKAVRDCPIPTVAAIHGACVGGGLEIAGCCDLRLASASSRFGAPINRLGFSMYPGEMEALLELVGAATLLEILLEGRILDAAEALQKGLVTRLVADAELDKEVAACVGRIAAGAPLVARWHKQWIRRLQQGHALSAEEKAASFAFLDTEDYRKGLAAFLNKEKVSFSGR